MKLLKESFIIFFWTMVIMGSLGAIVVSYFIFCERYGILWPTVGLVFFYTCSVFIAWLNEQIKKGGKKNEVPRVGSNRVDVSSSSGVVKLDDLTVSRAIQEARARDEDPRVRRVYPDDV